MPGLLNSQNGITKLYVYAPPPHVQQVVLVTDGSLGIGKGSLRHSLQTLKHRAEDKKFPLPFPFPCKFFILCVANAEEVPVHSFDRSGGGERQSAASSFWCRASVTDVRRHG